jgi:hypothetical protein
MNRTWNTVLQLAIIVVVLVAGYFVTHEDTERQVSAGERRAAVAACELSRINREVIRSVVEIATTPMSSTPVELPDAPDVPDATEDWVEDFANLLIAQGNDAGLRDVLLARAPQFRCTSKGLPITVTPTG